MRNIFYILQLRTGMTSLCTNSNTIGGPERRMAVLQTAQMADYASHLEDDPRGISTLVKELSTGVTSYFRNLSAFTGLGECLASDVPVEKILPRSIANDCCRGAVHSCAKGGRKIPAGYWDITRAG
jgi:chemotaxis methyl-accepting protein methylase